MDAHDASGVGAWFGADVSFFFIDGLILVLGEAEEEKERVVGGP